MAGYVYAGARHLKKKLIRPPCQRKNIDIMKYVMFLDAYQQTGINYKIL